jgi:hypothetical protein
MVHSSFHTFYSYKNNSISLSVDREISSIYIEKGKWSLQGYSIIIPFEINVRANEYSFLCEQKVLKEIQAVICLRKRKKRKEYCRRIIRSSIFLYQSKRL